MRRAAFLLPSLAAALLLTHCTSTQPKAAEDAAARDSNVTSTLPEAGPETSTDSSEGDTLPPNDSGASDGGLDVAVDGPPEAGGPCAPDGGCPAPFACYYALEAGCAAIGACYPPPQNCSKEPHYCDCQGNNYTGCPLPGGAFVPKPVAYGGDCIADAASE
jgi:hypothetical protein